MESVFQKNKNNLICICILAFSLAIISHTCPNDNDLPLQRFTISKVKNTVSSSLKTKIEKSCNIAFNRPNALDISNRVQWIPCHHDAGGPSSLQYLPFSNRAPPSVS
jgi:hypothetical protein